MNVKEIKEIIGEKKGVELLQTIASLFPNEVVFSTSFGIEDQVITEWIGKNNINIEIFTLDTGRLFKETYSLWSRTLERYQLPIKTYTADTTLLEDFISRKGPNSFYESVENRKECCRIRKIEPLQRAIKGKKNLGNGHPIRSIHQSPRYGLYRIR
ncbi:phosphoadenosine phosphosulfate reductase family protein [Sphingobacterium sp. B29]|uniref:phosphoadenosine phosphosulfate reductase family protein n=1 Tax=Sphingobacterium sp. B29 TaxID=1933220 RepID=UPI0026D6182B